MAGHTDLPLVSVVIVNYNGASFIESCLNSIFSADYPDFEVIFVDNASTDASLALVKEKFSGSGIKIIENRQSLGPVKGRNIGIKASRGKYVVFLDNDTEVDKNWLKQPVFLLENHRSIGCAQSKLLLSDRKTIDTCGHYLSIFGFPYEIGVGELDSGQYDNVTQIFGARSAAMFVRREALEKAGYFDGDYFMHSEETDLSWRLWLSGYKIILAPESVVYHRRGGSLNNESRYMMFYEGAKNCTKTLIKNLGLKRLLFILPLHIAGWIALYLSVLARRGLRLSSAIIKGLSWDARNIRHILEERKEIQGKRVVSDAKIMRIVLGPYGFLSLLKKGISWMTRT